MSKPPVGAVVVSYRPSGKLATAVELLLAQFDNVMVVDNSPQNHAGEVLDDLEKLERCAVIRNEKNFGIAAALNIGICYAISQGCQWIATFDQDSRIGNGFVAAMLATYQESAARCRVGVVCPRYRDDLLGVFLPTHRAANGDVFACMTSGSMIHTDTFQKFGPMDENLFIDYVDLDYCLRLRAAGLKVIECPNAVLEHSLGRMTRHKLLWKTFSTTNHSAKRRYYITRNRLVVMKRYVGFDREWAIADFKGLIAETIKIFLVEKDKLAKTGYILRGIFDAVFGRMGPRVPL